MVHLRQRVEHAWPDGIILVCKLSSGREASDTVRSRESQAAGAGRIYTTSSWLKGRDSFTTPGGLDSSIPFQYTCSSRPPSMIQGTGVWMMGGGGACAVLVPTMRGIWHPIIGRTWPEHLLDM